MMVHIRNAGEEREQEPMVSKKTFHKVVDEQKKHYEALRHEKNLMQEQYEHRINELMVKSISDRKRNIVAIIVTFVMGGGLGWLIH